ncbi:MULTISPECIES: S-layer homology domain-containing protein [Bacillus]|uniref:S-layer homology domain-containing protein n=1 Tax=Bacillus TaxID=1386 RepID=UPI00065E03A7|nr:S-layer homology domain-containing protein [Bacillus smithii]AKP46957.1 Alkaline phosphatase [Bacillus smithii]MED4882790.1 S-layer homology domain-containing protein [Bacillus smithii]MED4928861.1 S-layer homology domain-containing protein [Bacillus smithii]
MKLITKKGATFAFALALTIPAVTPVAAASNEKVSIDSIQFNGMNPPSTIDQMVNTYTDASVEVKYSDGRVRKFPLAYKTLFKSEDQVAANKGEKIPAGTPIDVHGNPIMDHSVEGKPTYFISDAPDSNSLLNIKGQLYMVTHYEYDTFDAAGHSAYGLVPASMTLTKLAQDKKTGELKAVEVKKIDFSSVNGLWIPCNGSVSPWNTHLGSEEYEPDARSFEFNPQSSARTWTESFAKLYFGDESKANPYYYGFIPEITVKEDGSTKVEKHYSVGRFSHELMKVMPDKRTAFFGDDGSYTTLFMYVADKPADLSAGTLYAAKFHQTGTENGGSGKLEWIKLGHATDKEIKDIIDSGIQFSDIFETSDAPKEGFTAIKQYSYGKTEYLKLKPGMEKAAAFLESRRYAAMLGATSEFNKMEGVALNAKDKKVYIAISDQSSGMAKDTKGTDPVDDIQLPVIKSGVTYQLDLTGGQKDKDGNAIDSDYVAATMSGLIAGEDLTTADSYGNTANVDKVANTDNLSYSEPLRTLFIGEDSGKHTNNFVWAYNVDTKKLSRILSVPAGAEATGLSAVDNMNGFSYILSNFQHPGDELDQNSITAVDKSELKKAMEEKIGIDKTGGVGYITGLPSLTKLPKPYKFKDVDKSHWAYEYVSDLQLRGIAKGMTEKSFVPNQNVTRGQFTSLIVRALGLEAKGKPPFKDIKGLELSQDIAAAYEAGIIDGKTKDKFAPNDTITREQTAKILMKAYEVKTGQRIATTHKTIFKDTSAISAEFLPYVNAAYEKGFLSGYRDGTFAPNKNLTRAQAAKLVDLFLKNVES